MDLNEMPFQTASDNDRALVRFGGVGCGNALLRAWEEVNARGLSGERKGGGGSADELQRQ
jgi:hypothetical protein